MQASKKSVATALLGAAMLAGAGAAQAQVAVSTTIGGVLTPGVYGQIVVGNTVPPLYSPTPILVQQPPVMRQPVYLYVPDSYRTNWARYCGRYNACNRPVYFVNGRAPEARRYRYYRSTPVAVRPAGIRRDGYWDNNYRHDRGRHKGWERGRGNPHRSYMR